MAGQPKRRAARLARIAAGLPPNPREPEPELKLNGRGSSPQYNPGYAAKVEKLVSLGATDWEIADLLGINKQTLLDWCVKYPEMKKALAFQESSEWVRDRAIRYLFAKAVGYTYDSEKVFCQDGKVTRVPIVEHIPPDVGALTYFLNNRDPDRWKSRQDSNVNLSAQVAAITAGMDQSVALAIFRAVIEGSTVEENDSCSQNSD